MKKGVLLLCLGILLILTVPVSAINIPMVVNFSDPGGGGDPPGGGGDPPGGGGGDNYEPEIKAMFVAAEGRYDAPNHERTEDYDIDDDWTLEGTQVDPPMEHNGTTWVGYYVFVFDTDGLTEIDHVNVHVWHPDDDDPYNPLGADDWDKYNLVLSEIPITDELLYFLDAVHTVEQSGNQLLCYGDEYTWEEFWPDLINGHFKIYYTHKEIHYCQPAGYYLIRAHAQDIHGAYDELDMYFEYVIGYGIETDFDSLDFGAAHLDTWKWLYGDWIFLEDDGMPTIRNIGNWDAKLTILYEDFGMGESDFGGEQQWNVVFDVRLGDKFWNYANRSYIEKTQDLHPSWSDYDTTMHPYVEYRIPSDWDPRGVNPTSPDIIEDDYFAKCNTSKISFGNLIRKPVGYQTYVGNLTISVNVSDHHYTVMDGLPCYFNP